MTTEEAIRVLGQYDVSVPRFFETDGEEIPWEDVADALELAMEALRREVTS